MTHDATGNDELCLYSKPILAILLKHGWGICNEHNHVIYVHFLNKFRNTSGVFVMSINRVQ